MESKKLNQKIIINLTNEEALVLLHWLSKFNNEDNYNFKDKSEKRVLWDLESVLENSTDGILSDNYIYLLESARKKINNCDLD